MKPLYWIALLLVIVGAVNWGLVGLFQFDLVAALFGGQTATLSRVVYTLVGLSGVVVAATSAALAGSRGVAVPSQSLFQKPMLWSVSVVACTETDPGTSPRSADGASTESC